MDITLLFDIFLYACRGLWAVFVFYKWEHYFPSPASEEDEGLGSFFGRLQRKVLDMRIQWINQLFKNEKLSVNFSKGGSNDRSCTSQLPNGNTIISGMKGKLKRKWDAKMVHNLLFTICGFILAIIMISLISQAQFGYNWSTSERFLLPWKKGEPVAEYLDLNAKILFAMPFSRTRMWMKWKHEGDAGIKYDVPPYRTSHFRQGQNKFKINAGGCPNYVTASISRLKLEKGGKFKTNIYQCWVTIDYEKGDYHDTTLEIEWGKEHLSVHGF